MLGPRERVFAQGADARFFVNNGHQVGFEGTGPLNSATLSPFVAELNALPYVSGSPFQSLQSPVGEVVGFPSHALAGNDASGYVAFEELFRGTAVWGGQDPEFGGRALFVRR